MALCYIFTLIPLDHLWQVEEVYLTSSFTLNDQNNGEQISSPLRKKSSIINFIELLISFIQNEISN